MNDLILPPKGTDAWDDLIQIAQAALGYIATLDAEDQ